MPRGIKPPLVSGSQAGIGSSIPCAGSRGFPFGSCTCRLVLFISSCVMPRRGSSLVLSIRPHSGPPHSGGPFQLANVPGLPCPPLIGTLPPGGRSPARHCRHELQCLFPLPRAGLSRPGDCSTLNPKAARASDGLFSQPQVGPLLTECRLSAGHAKQTLRGLFSQPHVGPLLTECCLTARPQGLHPFHGLFSQP